MIQIKTVAPEVLRKNPFQLIGKDWMLVTAGNNEHNNTMTASWGGFGVMYGKNVVYVFIRPQRYTKEFLDREETFSLSFFDKEYRKTLNYLGTVSGRTEDKIAKSGLTLHFIDDTPYFIEANLVITCKKLYKQTMNTEGLCDDKLKTTWYSNGDNHILYIAEIKNIMQIRHLED